MASSFVLDAGAFYAGIPFLSTSDSQYYTTKEVLDEVKHIKKNYAAVDVLLESGRIRLLTPEKRYVAQAISAAKKTGDHTRLSTADLSIIALALQLRINLMTDDYAAANVATLLKITVKPATAGKEIKDTRRWINYCSACSRTFGPDAKGCAICGNRLRRKHIRIR